MNPRTVCDCELVALLISANVAPLARFISKITSAFFLARLIFDVPAGFLAGDDFLLASLSCQPWACLSTGRSGEPTQRSRLFRCSLISP